jgi:hypothetical protein
MQVCVFSYLNVETNIVTRQTFNELLMMHLHRLNFSGDTSWSKSDNHSGLDNSCFDTAHRHCTNTTDLVHVLKG